MFPQYTATEYEKKCVEAGKNTEVYKEKLALLKKKWLKTDSIRDETTIMRLLGPVIYAPETSHLNIALIADNLDYFKKQYTIYSTVLNSRKLLDQACLCGSKTIADFLLGELKLTYLSLGYEHLLTYVAHSPNRAWAKELTQHMADAGKKVPAKLATLFLEQGSAESTASKSKSSI